jgi:hypothetical protein
MCSCAPSRALGLQFAFIALKGRYRLNILKDVAIYLEKFVRVKFLKMVVFLHFLGRKRTVPKAHQQFKIQIASNQIFWLSVIIYRIQLFNIWATGSFVTLKICPF